MVEVGDVLLAVFFFPVSLWLGYRAVAATGLYRRLSTVDAQPPPRLTGGETVAIEGDVVVEQTALGSDVVADTGSPVALLLWRATFPKMGQYTFDFTEWETTQAKSVFASGLESGRFVVDDGSHSVRVDPEWLTDVHDGTRLSAFTVGGIERNRSLHTYLWDSSRVHLTGVSTEVSLARLRGTVTTHNDSVDLDDYSFESKAVSEGSPLAVYGEVTLDRGTPVIRGTDSTPLLLSDRGVDGLRGRLGRRAVTYGCLSGVLLVVGTSLIALV